MRALSAAEILHLWEVGTPRPALERALLLLSAALPETPASELSALPLGPRDRRLLDLRAATFGPELPLFARCPACAQELDFALAAADLLAGSAEAESRALGPHELRTEAGVVRYRLPDSRDLAAAGEYPPEEAERVLLGRCVLEVAIGGAAVFGPDLPAELREALARDMAEADPQAEINIDLACPACAHRWTMLFDVLAVLWADVSRGAMRLLQEVDALARAYGWGESAVLALSAQRRALYLEMVTA